MKWFEDFIRKFVFFLFRLFLRNEQVTLPLDSTTIKKILILRYDVLGDMIVTTPVFNLLKEKLPTTEIHVLGSKRNVGLLKHDKRISKILCYECTIWSLFKLGFIGRSEKYDLILPLVFYKTTNAGLWANWVGGRKSIKIGWSNPWRAHLYSALLNAQIPSLPNKMTMSEIQVKFICDCFGWDYNRDLVKLSIELGAENEQYACDFYQVTKNYKRIIINISARENRILPEKNLRLLLKSFVESYTNIFLFLNAVGEDLQKANRLSEVCKEKIIVLPFSSDVLNLCALINQSDTVITPDTAIVHIAAAFDKPLIGLYPNSERICKEWGPQHDKAILVVPDGDNYVSDIEFTSIIEAFTRLNKKYSIV